MRAEAGMGLTPEGLKKVLKDSSAVLAETGKGALSGLVGFQVEEVRADGGVIIRFGLYDAENGGDNEAPALALSEELYLLAGRSVVFHEWSQTVRVQLEITA